MWSCYLRKMYHERNQMGRLLQITKDHPPWPLIVKAVSFLPRKERALDLGCGAGRDTNNLLKALVLSSIGALGPYDRALLVEQSILNALAMFGQCVGWQCVGRKVTTLASLFGSLERPTNYAAAERQNNLLLLWLGIDAHQLFYLDL